MSRKTRQQKQKSTRTKHLGILSLRNDATSNNLTLAEFNEKWKQAEPQVLTDDERLRSL